MAWFDGGEDYAHWMVRLFGALIGVVASLIIVAPEGTRNAFYRAWVGISMGVIFAPVSPHLPWMGWLQGDGMEFVLARSAAAGFSVWFCLELVARLLSGTDWLERLAREILRLKTKEASNGSDRT